MSQEEKTEIILYSKDDYKRDEKSFTYSEQNNKPVNWSAFSRLAINDVCLKSQVLENGYIGRVSLEDIEFALKDPRRRWRTLVRASIELMHISTHFYRLNTMFSNMALFQWWLDLYGVKENANPKTIKKAYTNLSEKLEVMNLKHEFSKIMRVLPYKDIYCGLVAESSTDFFFVEIDFRICKLYQTQDGLYNFAIDLGCIDKSKICAYPDYLQDAYESYRNGEIDHWYVPDSDKQICIKWNEQWTYPFPFLIGLVKDILDLDVYKNLNLQSARTDNYKAIMVQVPIDKNTVDKPMLTPETLSVFADINNSNLPDDVGMLYTLGSDGESISFKNSSDTRNKVSDAVDSIYDTSGINKIFFNEGTSATAVKYSMENSCGYIYKIYRQFERWLNRFIKIRKYNKSNYKFAVSILDSTIFNRDDVSKRYKESISMGATVIDKWLASMDMTPSKVLGSYIVHQDIFDFHNNFVPLQTSYNSSTDDKGGRPSAEENGDTISDEGEITKDKERNDR